MNKDFCTNCGHKNVYEINKPKFCSSCGNSLTFSVKSNSQSKDYDDDNEPTCLDSIDLNKLRGSISVENTRTKLSLNELWANPAPRENFYRAEFNGPEGEDLLKQIRKECSSSKSIELEDE